MHFLDNIKCNVGQWAHMKFWRAFKKLTPEKRKLSKTKDSPTSLTSPNSPTIVSSMKVTMMMPVMKMKYNKRMFLLMVVVLEEEEEAALVSEAEAE